MEKEFVTYTIMTNLPSNYSGNGYHQKPRTTLDGCTTSKMDETPNTALPSIRVLFIYPPVRLSAPPRVPPMGFLYMGTILEQAGIDVEILDLNALRLPVLEAMAEVRKRRFDVIGIGGMTTVYYYIKLLTKLIKQERPDVPIIGGGSASSASPDILVQQTGCDVACVGEGEPIIVDLVTALAQQHPIDHISGIVYRAANGETIHTLGRGRFEGWPEGMFPAHHLVDMDLYIKNNALKYGDAKIPGLDARIRELGLDPEQARRPLHVFSKRGCPFGCTFCYRNFGRKVVYDSVAHVLDYMEMLSARYHTQHFVFGDELFNVSEKWVFDFCDELKRRGKKYLLSTSNGLRASCCSEQSLQAMYDVGFYRVGIGIESFDDRSLKAMKKGQTAQQIKDAIRLIDKVGLKVNEGGMLFGYPTDDWDAMRANVEGLTEIGWFSTGFSIPCPYPGTYLYEEAIKTKAITDEEGWLMELADRDVSDRVVNLSGRLPEELRTMIQWGNDQLAINQLKAKYPLLSRVLDKTQPVGRKYGIDLLGTLYGVKQRVAKSARALRKDGIRGVLRAREAKEHREIQLGMDGVNMVNKQGLNGVDALDFTSGDRHLLAEVLDTLSKLDVKFDPLPFLKSSNDGRPATGVIAGPHMHETQTRHIAQEMMP